MLQKLVKYFVVDVNPYPADQDYCRFLFVLFVDQITEIGNKMCVQR